MHETRWARAVRRGGKYLGAGDGGAGGRDDLVVIVVFAPVSHVDAVRDAAARAGAGAIGDYRACSFSVTGEGRFEPLAGEAVVGKSVNAAFIGTDLDLRLRRMGIDTLVLFGISTDMCVSTTARMASNLGYRTVVVADACFCFDLADADGSVLPAEAISRAPLATLRAEFAEVAQVDAVVAMIAAGE